MVSNLRIPGFERPWEENFGKPEDIVDALNIIIEAPLGSAAFNNKFSHLSLNGYFLTYEEKIESHNSKELRGYHKPIMLIGGIGNIFEKHIKKKEVNLGVKIIALGSPVMNVGLDGSTALSNSFSQYDTNLSYLAFKIIILRWNVVAKK